MILLGLLAGVGMAVGALLIVGILTGRYIPRRPTGSGRVATWARRVWRGPYRGDRERRDHQRRIVVAAVIGVLVWLFTAMPVIGLLVAVAIPGLPWLLGAGKLEQAAIDRLEATESWTRRLKDLVDTGTGLQQAIVDSVETVPVQIEPEVRDLAARIQAGHDPIDALYLFADDLDDQYADEVVASLLQHLTVRGARLGEILVGIADAAAEQVATRREVHSERANGRLTLNVLTAMAGAVFALGVLVPEYVRPYATGVGQLILLAAVSAFIGLLLLARRVNLPRRPTRFLSRPLVESPADSWELAQ